jgi:hypothetical protein
LFARSGSAIFAFIEARDEPLKDPELQLVIGHGFIAGQPWHPIPIKLAPGPAVRSYGRLPLVHIVAGASWRPTEVDTFTETREGTVSSLREPPSLADNDSELIDQQVVQRAALCNGQHPGGMQQFRIDREGDSRFHRTLRD